MTFPEEILLALRSGGPYRLSELADEFQLRVEHAGLELPKGWRGLLPGAVAILELAGAVRKVGEAWEFVPEHERAFVLR